MSKYNTPAQILALADDLEAGRTEFSEDAAKVIRALVALVKDENNRHAEQRYDEGNPKRVLGSPEQGHRLGRVHGGMRWCLDRGCNWGRPAREGER